MNSVCCRREQAGRDRRGEDAVGLDDAIAESVRRQAARLRHSPPVVEKRYAGKKIEIDIVGGVYDLATGKVALV